MRHTATKENGPRPHHTEHTHPGSSLQTEQRARAAQRLTIIGEMAGGIAHDFRNLLAVIESGLGLVEKSYQQPEKARSYIAVAREGIDRGLKLTSQLLTFAKLQELEARAGDVNNLLRNLLTLLKFSAGPGVRIAFQLEPDIPKCLVEPSQFDAAVLNLVVNARDAMPSGGELHISTGPYATEDTISDSTAFGSYVRVRISDSGQGMSAEMVRKVFDPFFTTKRENGTGMGLPHVLACMRHIGGDVRVTSKLGSGTTVDLLFPSLDPGGIVALQAEGKHRHRPVLRP